MRKLICMALLFPAGNQFICARPVTASGRIIDATGAGIANVSISVLGTKTGAATNADGSFSFAIQKKQTLQAAVRAILSRCWLYHRSPVYLAAAGLGKAVIILTGGTGMHGICDDEFLQTRCISTGWDLWSIRLVQYDFTCLRKK